MKIKKEHMLLYAVTDRTWLQGQSLYDAVEEVLKGGATLVQLREKHLSQAEFLEEAKALLPLCHRYHVPLIINDNAEVAQKSGADGVHVGQSDMAVRAARALLGEDKIVGASAHNAQEARDAVAAGADYLGCGAVFGSTTKLDVGTLPHDVLAEICAAVDVPIVAIGGICEQNILALSRTGVDGIAVISALFAQRDKAAAAKRLLALSQVMIGEKA